MSKDPVLVRLADRRRNAERQIQRGNAIVQQGKAELAECDRFEAFYRDAIGRTAFQDSLANIFDSPAPSVAPVPQAPEAVTRRLTLKEAILEILNDHPEGLESGDLLACLQQAGFTNLPRTTMSPQLSRLRASNDLTNEGGRWKIKNNEAAGSADPTASSHSGLGAGSE